jgi:hypothetical protein
MWAVVIWIAYLYAASLLFSMLLCVIGWATLAFDMLRYGPVVKPLETRL